METQHKILKWKLLPVILESSPRPRRQQPTEKGSRPSLRSSRWITRRMKSVFDEFKNEVFAAKPRRRDTTPRSALM